MDINELSNHQSDSSNDIWAALTKNRSTFNAELLQIDLPSLSSQKEEKSGEFEEIINFSPLHEMPEQKIEIDQNINEDRLFVD